MVTLASGIGWFAGKKAVPPVAPDPPAAPPELGRGLGQPAALSPRPGLARPKQQNNAFYMTHTALKSITISNSTLIKRES